MTTTGATLPAEPNDTGNYNKGSNLFTGTLTATLSSGMAQANVYGLLLVQSDLEATLGQINYTLGYPINTGVSQFNWNPNAPQVATTLPFNNAGRPTDCTASLWDTCTGAYAPTAYALGANGLETGTDEVAAPLFVKAAGATAVSMTVVARFSPYGSLPFGWYASTAPTTLNPVGTMDYTADLQTNSKARMVFPPTCKGSTMQACPTTEFDATYTFDPAAASFGLYVYSDQNTQKFGEGGTKTNGDYDYGQDSLNSPAGVHRMQVFPLKTAAGVVANSYEVAVEEAANGDYQDYVFVLSGVSVAP
jgi:hypothetical protein